MTNWTYTTCPRCGLAFYERGTRTLFCLRCRQPTEAREAEAVAKQDEPRGDSDKATAA